jgi:hypothetical protein
MCEETKIAVIKAFEIGKIIFSIGKERYSLLLKVTSSVKYPTKSELVDYIEEEGLCRDDAAILELKRRYREVAVNAGFTEEQGLAVLEYASMLEDLRTESL